MSAGYALHGRVAVITLDNPPVNGMNHALRTSIVEGIDRAHGDSSVSAIVLTGAGGLFSGGADIREFTTPQARAEPTLPTVIAIVESSEKPVIAAIGGSCMGGGLELALGCHFRVAVPHAQIALPEVKLGLLPGAGGVSVPNSY
jgi:3-hydroxyacyl-CoA dehydrogenase